jgi:hypothetical protein
MSLIQYICVKLPLLVDLARRMHMTCMQRRKNTALIDDFLADSQKAKFEFIQFYKCSQLSPQTICHAFHELWWPWLWSSLEDWHSGDCLRFCCILTNFWSRPDAHLARPKRFVWFNASVRSVVALPSPRPRLLPFNFLHHTTDTFHTKSHRDSNANALSTQLHPDHVQRLSKKHASEMRFSISAFPCID